MGSKPAKGGPYPVADLDRGSKSAVTPGEIFVTKGNIFICALFFFFFKYQSLPQRRGDDSPLNDSRI